MIHHFGESGSVFWSQLDKHSGYVLGGFMAVTNMVGVPQPCALAYWLPVGGENYFIFAVLDVMVTSLLLSRSQCHIRDQVQRPIVAQPAFHVETEGPRIPACL